MIRIGEAASGEQEALIWGSLPGEGSFCRQLTREKRGPLIKVLFVLIFSFAPGEAHREGRDPAGGRRRRDDAPPSLPPRSGSEKERQRVEHQDGVTVGRGFVIRGLKGSKGSCRLSWWSFIQRFKPAAQFASKLDEFSEGSSGAFVWRCSPALPLLCSDTAAGLWQPLDAAARPASN